MTWAEYDSLQRFLFGICLSMLRPVLDRDAALGLRLALPGAPSVSGFLPSCRLLPCPSALSDDAETA